MSLIAFVAVVAACALTGAMFEPGEWYAALAKPAGTPPNWLFGPVWTTLYVMIAVAGWLLWRAEKSAQRASALTLWALQLGLNAAWSWLCFGQHALGWALLDIAALLLAILVLTTIARRVRRAAAWLLVPYALWVGYATWLNWSLWRLN